MKQHLIADHCYSTQVLGISYGFLCSGQKSPITKKPAFRPEYGKLGELRSLAGPSIPVIALTATASLETQGIVKNILCMTESEDVIVSPNKPNIKYVVHAFDTDDVRANFTWLVQLLREKGADTPRMIIFFRKIEHMSTVYKHVIFELRQTFTDAEKPGKNNRFVDMFHMKTTDSVKEAICRSYHEDSGTLRVVLCTTSFSMGLDVKGVDTVVHYGPANNLEDYLQETGRAGRNPNEKCHAVMIKYKRSTGSKNISANMKEFVLSSSCRRKRLLRPFTTDLECVTPSIIHDCCDICAKLCKCLCNCSDTCNCKGLCSVEKGVVSHYIEKMRQKDSSSSSNEQDSSTEFLTDSDFEGYVSKKPQILTEDISE